MNSMLDYDYGPQFNYLDGSGVITVVPPVVKQVIPTYAVKVDADGNEIAGLRSVLQRMPLGTYTGWNPIATGIFKGQEQNLAGGYLPFAKTKAERVANGDPRPSIEERYPNIWGYYFNAMQIANELVAEALLARRGCQPHDQHASQRHAVDGAASQAGRVRSGKRAGNGRRSHIEAPRGRRTVDRRYRTQCRSTSKPGTPGFDGSVCKAVRAERLMRREHGTDRVGACSWRRAATQYRDTLRMWQLFQSHLLHGDAFTVRARRSRNGFAAVMSTFLYANGQC